MKNEKRLNHFLIKKKIARIIGYSLIVIASFMLIIVLPLTNDRVLWILIIIFLGFLIYFALSYNKVRTRDKILYAGIKIPNIKYNPKGFISKRIVLESKAFPFKETYTYKGFDLFSGRICEYIFHSADTHIYYTVTGKKKHRVNVFKGRWTTVNIDKKYLFSMVLKEEEKYFSSMPVKALINEYNDTDFNDDKYKLYTDEPLELFMHLSKEKIFDMLKIIKAYQGKMAIAINGSYLNVALYEDDYFQIRKINTFKNVKDEVDKFINLTKQVIDIINK